MPKKFEFKLPPVERDDKSSDGSDDESTWDELSAIDGIAWIETASDEVRIFELAFG